MNTDLNELIKMLNSGQFVTSRMFNKLDLDDALDERDSEIFDIPWVLASDEIESGFESTGCDENTAKGILLLRERSFKKVYEITGNGEIAGYISDDFELFGKSILIEYKNDWLSGVFKKYCLETFPTGEIQPLNESINELITNKKKKWGQNTINVS